MKLHYDMSYEDKIAKLKAIKQEDELLNRLFFQGRNGAVSNLRLEVQDYFTEKGFKVKCLWKEDSRYCCVETVLIDKYEHCRTHFIDRDSIHPPASLNLSSSVYKLRSVQSSEYYGKVKPKKAVDYDAILASNEFKEILNKLVNGVNYPFAYESQSSV